MALPLLYGYWRSTAAYRVRIALALKGLEYRTETIDLVKEGGEQHGAEYRALNPAGLVPTLVIDGQVLTQSLAICEYLEETRPSPALLPREPGERALARAIALDIACDVHPVNNLRVQQFLQSEWGHSQSELVTWMHHWMSTGFTAVEMRLKNSACKGACAVGHAPGLADAFLVAQAYNADRFGFGLDDFPLVQQVIRACRALAPFQQALPENQADAPVE